MNSFLSETEQIGREFSYEAVGTLEATYASGAHFIPVWRFTALVCHSHTDDSAQLLDLSLLFITTPFPLEHMATPAEAFLPGTRLGSAVIALHCFAFLKLF